MRRWADERNRDYDTYFAVIPGRPQIILKGESMRREAFDLDERDGLSHVETALVTGLRSGCSPSLGRGVRLRSDWVFAFGRTSRSASSEYARPRPLPARDASCRDQIASLLGSPWEAHL